LIISLTSNISQIDEKMCNILFLPRVRDTWFLSISTQNKKAMAYYFSSSSATMFFLFLIVLYFTCYLFYAVLSWITLLFSMCEIQTTSMFLIYFLYFFCFINDLFSSIFVHFFSTDHCLTIPFSSHLSTVPFQNYAPEKDTISFFFFFYVLFFFLLPIFHHLISFLPTSDFI
jgi:hypothetical protein